MCTFPATPRLSPSSESVPRHLSHPPYITFYPVPHPSPTSASAQCFSRPPACPTPAHPPPRLQPSCASDHPPPSCAPSVPSLPGPSRPPPRPRARPALRAPRPCGTNWLRPSHSQRDVTTSRSAIPVERRVTWASPPHTYPRDRSAGRGDPHPPAAATRIRRPRRPASRLQRRANKPPPRTSRRDTTRNSFSPQATRTGNYPQYPFMRNMLRACRGCFAFVAV
jgi:hypothetical protein